MVFGTKNKVHQIGVGCASALPQPKLHNFVRLHTLLSNNSTSETSRFSVDGATSALVFGLEKASHIVKSGWSWRLPLKKSWSWRLPEEIMNYGGHCVAVGGRQQEEEGQQEEQHPHRKIRVRLAPLRPVFQARSAQPVYAAKTGVFFVYIISHKMARQWEVAWARVKRFRVWTAMGITQKIRAFFIHRLIWHIKNSCPGLAT